MISNLTTLQKNLKRDSSILPMLKVALVGDTATQFLAVALKGIGIERGFKLDLFEADYNQVERQLLDASSELHVFDADYIVVFQSTHKLLSGFNKMPLEKQHTLADERVEFVRTIASTNKSRLIYFNYPEID
ncbi:MAG: hypothetical protein GX371_08680, partial [Bacteroidales bacterium]|nr:hypothetical protein [Bacteroidales bacterium]